MHQTMSNKKILIIGAAGQIGTEITQELYNNHGKNKVIATDIKPINKEVLGDIAFETLNVMDINALKELFIHYDFETSFYH